MEASAAEMRTRACRRMRQPLDIANDIVAKEADGAAPELAELGNLRRRIAAQQFVQIV